MCIQKPTTNDKALRHGQIGAFLASLGLGLCLSACQIQAADFSAYSGKNLIPDAQLDVWTADQDLSTSPGNLYMNFERIDNASGSYAATTGFADSTALYSGLPAEALKSDGTQPPVYRLEVKNLFKDGDLELSTVGVNSVASGTGAGPSSYISGNNGRFKYYQSGDLNARYWGIIDATDATHYLGLNSGKVLTVEQGTNDTIFIDLTNNLTISSITNASYNLGLSIFIKNPLDYYLCFGIIDNATGKTTSENSFFHIYSTSTGIMHFPKDSSGVVTASSTFDTFNGNNSLIINSLTHPSAAISAANFDDFKVVRTDQTYAIRYEVPYATGAGLNLVQGGTYTLSAWVRQDPTAAWGNANRGLNRFSADKISLAISDNVGNAGQYWPNGASGAQGAPSGTDWTKISASFTGLLNNSTTYNNARATQKMLQLTITALDTTSDGSQFPGSILITSPSLTFTP
jgi:hypothetical protein